LDLITRNTDLHHDTGEERWRSARQVFTAVADSYVRLVASPLIEAEVLCNGTTQERKRRSDMVAQSLHTWFNSPETLWVDVDRIVAQESARLSEQYGHLRKGDRRFGATDAMHLAAALRARCNFLMTHDGGFPIGHDIEGVQVILPTVVWQETLFDNMPPEEQAQ
jgi:hypothetical protein